MNSMPLDSRFAAAAAASGSCAAFSLSILRAISATVRPASISLICDWMPPTCSLISACWWASSLHCAASAATVALRAAASGSFTAASWPMPRAFRAQASCACDSAICASRAVIWAAHALRVASSALLPFVSAWCSPAGSSLVGRVSGLGGLNVPPTLPMSRLANISLADTACWLPAPACASSPCCPALVLTGYVLSSISASTVAAWSEKKRPSASSSSSPCCCCCCWCCSEDGLMPPKAAKMEAAASMPGLCTGSWGSMPFSATAPAALDRAWMCTWKSVSLAVLSVSQHSAASAWLPASIPGRSSEHSWPASPSSIARDDRIVVAATSPGWCFLLTGLPGGVFAGVPPFVGVVT
mmetsp:Transcript_14597/g.39490  ORF Transcript_14597/g.39490 Transcript_14597/m.39490 type:complete len:355 (-) Transcript_14597:166-1230(-)